ncbi:putative Nucleolar complex-associated protein, partial [Zostera marina]
MGRRKGVILPPDFPPEIGEEEVVVSEEDFEFVNSSHKYSGFLQNLDTKSIDRHVGRIADRKEDALEAQYEKRNRQKHHENPSQEGKLQVDPVDALPIKIDGELKYRRAKETKFYLLPKDNGEGVDEKVDDIVDKSILRPTKVERRQKLKKSKREAKKLAKVETNVDDEEKNMHAEVLANAEKDLSFEEIFLKKKSKLAELGISLLEDPDTNIKFLNDLMNFCNDDDKNIVKLACLSLLTVFKDIIPGYQIRLPTEKELEMNISKTVRKMRFYEHTLLTSYKAYLLRLVALEKKPFFCYVAVRCMCTLLEAVPHFNFRDSLLVSIVKNISCSDDEI